MKKNLINAGLIAGAILLWLASGVFTGPDDEGNDAVTAVLPPPADAPMRVRVREVQAQQRTLTKILRGKTESKRSAEVSAEIRGRVVARPVERGDRVTEGTVLCELAVDEREAVLAEAQAKLERAELEFRGAQELKQRDLLSEINIAQVQADVATARARVRQETLNLERTRIRAPFDGVVEQLHLDVGDLAAVGTPCATVLDLDPLLITADASERDVGSLRIGDPVTARTSTDQRLEGTVTFIGSVSDDATRTYPIEVTVPNPDYQLRAGLTTVVSVATDTVLAHQVSPSLFTLDDDGVMGLRTVDSDDHVVFHPVTVVEDGAAGAWVTGLPGIVRLITVGQEFVAEGQRVEPVDEGTPPATASAL